MGGWEQSVTYKHLLTLPSSYCREKPEIFQASHTSGKGFRVCFALFFNAAITFQAAAAERPHRKDGSVQSPHPLFQVTPRNPRPEGLQDWQVPGSASAARGPGRRVQQGSGGSELLPPSPAAPARQSRENTPPCHGQVTVRCHLPPSTRDVGTGTSPLLSSGGRPAHPCSASTRAL